MSVVRTGIIGYGAIGRHHARNLNAMDGVELVGIVDASPERRREAESLGLSVLPSSEALLKERIDAAIISVPTSEHERVALQFIEHNCAVLIEKPIASDVASGLRLIEIARQKNVPLMVGYVERYNPAISALRDFMNDGNLGKIFSISARRVGVLPPQIRDANVLVDIAVHEIDLAAFLTNSPLQLVSAQGGRAILDDRVDYASLALNAGGAAVDIVTNWITPVKLRELAIYGASGYCHVDYMTQTVKFAPGRQFSPTSTYEALVAQYSSGEFIYLPVEKEEPLRRELEVFISGVNGAAYPIRP